MDTKALDKALQEIVKKREELDKIDYNNPKYDDLEEQLHDLEDAFQDNFGEYIEEALQEVHDEYCADNDILYVCATTGTTGRQKLVAEIAGRVLRQSRRAALGTGGGSRVRVSASELTAFRRAL